MSVLDLSPSRAAADAARTLALENFSPPGKKSFGSSPAWAALRALGTELWLDTGDLEAASALWTDEFSNLTTNNTLVNKEVQKGLFDDVIPRVARAFREADPGMPDDTLVIEVGFVVNCRTALRLVGAFDAGVSVELHPGMGDDADLSVEYGRRYYAVCPERFIVKVPLTPAGLLAAGRLSSEGIPVNFTLGFSARQNVLAASFSRPSYVNVFMGRLNSFVADNGLGDGEYVGEKAAMATQVALRKGREERGWRSRLIGASMRSEQQLFDLAGLDVFTMPTAAAASFKQSYERAPRPLTSQVGRDFAVEVQPAAVAETLWHVDDGVLRAAEALQSADTSHWTGTDLAGFVREHGASNVFYDWSPAKLEQIHSDGKIPKWERWREELVTGRMALDNLMSVSALGSFITDQTALDGRIRRLLQENGLAAR